MLLRGEGRDDEEGAARTGSGSCAYAEHVAENTLSGTKA